MIWDNNVLKCGFYFTGTSYPNDCSPKCIFWVDDYCKLQRYVDEERKRKQEQSSS